MIKQIGTHPGMVLNPQIDIDNTLKSINIYDSLEIPCPQHEEQVLSVKWLATLDKAKTSKIHSSVIPF